MAMTGHKKEYPKFGMVIVLVVALSCMVLDYFTNKTTLFSQKHIRQSDKREEGQQEKCLKEKKEQVNSHKPEVGQ